MSVATFVQRLGLVVTAVWLAAGQARGDLYSISGTFANKDSLGSTGFAGGSFSGTYSATLSNSGGKISSYNIELVSKNGSKTFDLVSGTFSSQKGTVSLSGKGSKQNEIFTFNDGNYSLTVSMPSKDRGVGASNAGDLMVGHQEVMTKSSLTTVAAAPEPSTFLPAIFGSVAFAGYFWRRRSRAIAA